ncbi:relaxase/mobilization nuclease domain-containing protein, partial [Synergistaceae bacterium OttesenSCG-928-I11]|nr:relaxase/mobilization nuclease domain-containing protein [Synergistaceae bacterium OttesenSCG-928-I11]
QTLYSLHQNTDNLHLHICVNRIDPDTHRAITAAGGWTRRAMEHAARRIEAGQGWQVEENTWSEVNELGELVQKPKPAEEKIPQPVQDKENQNGEQSAIRKAQEVLKATVKNQNFSSWDELHALLQKNGMEYRKKGSGAIVLIGDIPVKASAVSRNLALNKLEKRFGTFRPLQEKTLLDSANIERTSNISDPKPLSTSNDTADWRTYAAARSTYYEEKRGKRGTQQQNHQDEKSAMQDRQQIEREELMRSLNGKGYGRQHINNRRSTLSTRHAYERALLKESQKKEREEFQRANPSFPSYEEWLRNRGLATKADEWRHRKNKKFLQMSAPDDCKKIIAEVSQQGLPGFQMLATQQGVKFYRDMPANTSFLDAGQKIRVYREDDDTLLAALQLAQQKWGGVHLSGSDDYIRRCAELAARNGIRIANPELREMMAAAAETPEEKEQRMQEERKALRHNTFELARKWFPQGTIIMTNALENKGYSGVLLGVVQNGGRFYAVQAIEENRVIIHSLEMSDVPAFEDMVGRNVDIKNGDTHTSTMIRAQNQMEERRKNWRR